MDELAHGLALAFSSKDVTATAATVGPQQGFDIDLTGIQPGDSISLTYTPTPPGTPQTVTFVRVDDPTQLPLSNDVTADPNDTVFGVDFSGGIAAAATTIDTLLGVGVSVSNPSGNTLRVLDDGAIGTTDIDAVTATVTSTAVQDDGLSLPLFIDGGLSPQPYTASFEGGSQKTGFAARITLNLEVAQDNELLVRHTTSPLTPLGDPDRPLELLSRLTDREFTFSPASGIGSPQRPLTTNITSFAERVISEQTGKANSLERAMVAQDVVLTSLRERFADESGVDINEELSDLINLQNAFAANARMIQAVDELMQILINL